MAPIACALLALLRVNACAQPTSGRGGLRTEIRYEHGEGASQPPIEFHSATGTRYLLALAPECEQPEGDTDGLQLTLYPANAADRGETNLLSPPGNWHGMQDFDFLAWDLVHGPDKSQRGAERIWDVRPLHLRLHAVVTHVDVKAGAPHTPGKVPDDSLQSLTVSLHAERLPAHPLRTY